MVEVQKIKKKLSPKRMIQVVLIINGVTSMGLPWFLLVLVQILWVDWSFDVKVVFLGIADSDGQDRLSGANK